MNLKTKLMGLGLAVIAMAVPATAQDSGFYVGGSFSYASGMSLKDTITKSDLGFVVDGGYVGKLASTDVPVRTSLSYLDFPGKKDAGMKASLTGIELATDIFIKTPVDKLRLISGICLTKWSLKVDSDDLGSFTNSVKGIKFGGRIGADYAITPKLSAEMLLQVVELGTDQDFTRQPNGLNGIVGINPVWLQIGVKYHF
jgi:hypothetical protein